MANTKQAAKRAKKSVKSRAHNMSMRSEMRTAIKKVYTALTGGDAGNAAATLQESTATIDKMARKGIIHKNKAARHKSRLAARVKALAGGART
jgi:small subunit ribosomal protein S20